MKNMEMTPATAFRPPLSREMIRVSRAMTPVATSASRGSPPADSRRKTSLQGSRPFWARACITRGAATSDPRAEEKVAPRMPIRMAQPQSALSTMIVSVAISSAGVAAAASQTTSTR